MGSPSEFLWEPAASVALARYARLDVDPDGIAALTEALRKLCGDLALLQRVELRDVEPAPPFGTEGGA